MAEKISRGDNNDPAAVPKSSNPKSEREEKLAKQLRDNLAKRKQQSRARNTKPRKFKNTAG